MTMFKAKLTEYKDKLKKVVPVSVGVAACSSFPALAEGTGTSVVSSTDWQPIIDAITPQVSVSTIVGVLATAVAAVIGLVFMWWGARKGVRMLMAAFRKGKVSV